MLTAIFLELVDALLIRLSSRELSVLLGLVSRELKLRGDVCASNHVARGVASHAQFLVEHPTRVRPGAESAGDSGAAYKRWLERQYPTG